MAPRRVLILQVDGKIPNLALMRIAGHHRRRGDLVELRHASRPSAVERGLFDAPYAFVYAGAIFERSRPVCERLRDVYPRAIIGGTGWSRRGTLDQAGIAGDEPPDYADYPAFPHSLGFTQRGCRLKCSFCCVPEKEGAVRESGGAYDIWRGDPWPRHLLLLDNDFFGQPRWREKIAEFNDGGFKVCWNQGFNVRLIGDEEAEAIASTHYADDQFKTRRLYTAWDNRKDEDRLFRNLKRLRACGVRPDDVVVYMLVGYDHERRAARPALTEDDFHRHRKLREFGCRPYPMPFVKTREINGFQRWIVKRIDCFVGWDEFRRADYRPERFGRGDAGAGLFGGDH